MARRAPLPWIILLAVVLHAVGIARTVLPAQDGLKFLRVARQFQTQPWTDVVRASDQHPLYPAAVAAFEPVLRALGGPGPETWRIAAQLVSALASIALLVPLYLLSRSLFSESVAALAAFLFVMLPIPATIGRDTLSDAMALSLFTLAFACAEATLRTGRIPPAIGCGIAAGLGYWTRPEVAILPLVVILFVCLRAGRGWLKGLSRRPEFAVEGRLVPAMAVSFLAIVGAYGMVKGEVSEKLAVRTTAQVASIHDRPRAVSHPLPKGLDRRDWDFAPKEESNHEGPRNLVGAVRWTLHAWAEGLGGLFAVLAVLGAWKVQARGPGRGLVATFLVVFAAFLVRHAATLHYLSGRHVLTLVVVSLPWAAAGAIALGKYLATRWHQAETPVSRWSAVVLIACAVVVGAVSQFRPEHRSRAAHLSAGRWLSAHANPGDAVLDTRGWAAFVSDLPAYDPWHIPQALSDSRLAFVVIGADELSATSRRGATWRALLAYAAEPVATFPNRPATAKEAVCVYRFHPPTSWEGMQP